MNVPNFNVFRMANLKFEPKNNVPAFLNEDCDDVVGYEEIIRFLLRKKYVYAMCAKPVIYAILIKRLRRTAEISINDEG